MSWGKAYCINVTTLPHEYFVKRMDKQQMLCNQSSRRSWTRAERRIYDLLSAEEQAIAEYYYIDNMTQTEVGLKLQLSQGGVSHTIRRIRKRVKWIQSLPECFWHPAPMAYRLTRAWPDICKAPGHRPILNPARDLIDIWVELTQSGDQSAVARSRGIRQCQVKWRFDRLTRRIERVPGLRDMAELAGALEGNWYMLRRYTCESGRQKRMNYDRARDKLYKEVIARSRARHNRTEWHSYNRVLGLRGWRYGNTVDGRDIKGIANG